MEKSHMRVIVTRPLLKAVELKSELSSLGISVLSFPLLTINFLPSIPPQKKYQGIVITSIQALLALENFGLIPSLMDYPLYAVGEGSGKKALSLGFSDVHIASGDVSRLFEKIQTLSPGLSFLYPCGKIIRSDLPHLLQESGFLCDRWVVYSADPVSSLCREVVEAIEGSEPLCMPFYSTRTAQTWVKLLAAQDGGDLYQKAKKIRYLCLSEAVKQPLFEAFPQASFLVSPDLYHFSVVADLCYAPPSHSFF